MKPWERWAFFILSAAVSVSGFLYLWMKYMLETDDPFAVVNHPWQTTMLHAHVLVSPFLILVFGIVFNSHIMKKLKASARERNRLSGYTSLGTFAALVGSGYLLQVVTGDVWLRGLVVAHVASGVLFSVAYGTHLVATAAQVRRRIAVPRVREVA